MFWQVYDNIIAKMLINSFGLNQFWSGVVMALDNILALFLLPFFGNISDKTKTKYGKRTPYIFVGVILSAILFAQDSKIISEIKSPHHIVTRIYDDETCSIQVQLNSKTSAIYVFFGVTNSELFKFAKLINAEFYEDKTIDRRFLTA